MICTCDPLSARVSIRTMGRHHLLVSCECGLTTAHRKARLGPALHHAPAVRWTLARIWRWLCAPVGGL